MDEERDMGQQDIEDFLWPSDQERTDNEELERVCVFAEQLQDLLWGREREWREQLLQVEDLLAAEKGKHDLLKRITEGRLQLLDKLRAADGIIAERARQHAQGSTFQCKHGAILYGNSCLNCEREKAQQGGES